MEVTFALLGILVGNNGLVCVEASFQFYPGEHLRARECFKMVIHVCCEPSNNRKWALLFPLSFILYTY